MYKAMSRGCLITTAVIWMIGCGSGEDAQGTAQEFEETCDACGVCDEDLTNDCVQDCAGGWGGMARLDECGTCDIDPENDCVADCAGESGGLAVEDDCGVCDADPANDCDTDCAGSPGGDAIEDDCGTCDADPTNDCVQDCDGSWGGMAALDECGTCDIDPANDCVQDCAGNWGGMAAVDNCGTCDADPSNDCPADCNGVFGGMAVADMCGTCDADPANDCVMDCAGNYGGLAVMDMCGTCDADPANDCVMDCAGNYGGLAVMDMCGTCDADASNDCVMDCAGNYGGLAAMDMCGTCDVDPANDCLQDCNADWGGTASLDKCGVCIGGMTGRNSACVSLTLPILADATVSAASPNTNYGTSTTLEVDPPWNSASEEKQVFLRFDLSALPANTVIRGANLVMNAYQGYAWGGNGNVYAHHVDDDTWNENTITWNNKPANAAADLGFWWLWYDFPPSNQIGQNSSQELVDAVREETVFGNSQISLMLQSSGYRTDYRSKEFGTAALRPALEISFVPENTLIIGPEADATVNGGANNGAATSLLVRSGNSSNIFIRFNLASIPPGSLIHSASLEMTAYDGYAWGGDGNVYAYLVIDDSWDQSTITTANAPTSLTTALGYWWLWYDGTNSDKLGVNKSLHLTNAIVEEAATDGKVSLKLGSSGYDTDYYSSESAQVAKRPRLVVKYSAP